MGCLLPLNLRCRSGVEIHRGVGVEVVQVNVWRRRRSGGGGVGSCDASKQVVLKGAVELGG